MTARSYPGTELELFRKARNWKAYYKRLIAIYLGREVLEVGAGIGATTQMLCNGQQERWLCLEPDPAMAETLATQINNEKLPRCCEVRVGVVAELKGGEVFDSIIYIDVLEHIEDDRLELEMACSHLKVGGFLTVLSPAHQWLYSRFDETLGHYRRYSKGTLLRVVPRKLECIQLKYLDTVGVVASLANKLVLQQDSPTSAQVAIWDKVMIPLSTALDPLSRYRLGKSILATWRRR
jgi:SAM-dependent methyltransferase